MYDVVDQYEYLHFALKTERFDRNSTTCLVCSKAIQEEICFKACKLRRLNQHSILLSFISICILTEATIQFFFFSMK